MYILFYVKDAYNAEALPLIDTRSSEVNFSDDEQSKISKIS